MLIPLIVGLALLVIGIFLFFTTGVWFLDLHVNVCCGPANILTQSMIGNEYFCHSA